MERQFQIYFGCVVSMCFVGFASLDVVCDEPNDCAWNVAAFLFVYVWLLCRELCSYRVLQ